jgi:hypothetical protein
VATTTIEEVDMAVVVTVAAATEAAVAMAVAVAMVVVDTVEVTTSISLNSTIITIRNSKMKKNKRVMKVKHLRLNSIRQSQILLEAVDTLQSGLSMVRSQHQRNLIIRRKKLVPKMKAKMHLRCTRA